MRSRHLFRALRVIVAFAWIAFFLLAYERLHALGIPVRQYPHALRLFLQGLGVYGPLILLALYLARSIVFVVPVTILTLVAGSVYGPVWGILLNIVGENLCANIAFGLSRLVGRRFVRERESGWLKRYDDLFRQEGFLSVLFMRMLYFPFDLINYGAGVSSMLYRQYAFGTLIGTLPSIITLTVLGGAFTKPRVLIWFLVLFIVTLGGAVLLRRSAWVRRRLYPPHVVEHV